MSQQIDETRLQRLVDGALNEDERRALLAGLEERPELWREVALAFVEEQIWQHEIACVQHCDDARPDQTPCVVPTKTSRRSWVTMLALSVSLFVMLAVGFQLGEWRSSTQRVAAPIVDEPGGDEDEAGTIDSADPEIQDSPWRGTDNLASDYRLVLPHEEGQIVEMPVYEESQFDAASWEYGDPVIVEELNKRLSRRGYRADWQTEYLTGRLDDGRQLVVPWRTVSLRYDAQ